MAAPDERKYQKAMIQANRLIATIRDRVQTARDERLRYEKDVEDTLASLEDLHERIKREFDIDHLISAIGRQRQRLYDAQVANNRAATAIGEAQKVLKDAIKARQILVVNHEMEREEHNRQKRDERGQQWEKWEQEENRRRDAYREKTRKQRPFNEDIHDAFIRDQLNSHQAQAARSQATHSSWWDTVATAFADLPNMVTFPEPPTRGSCGVATCLAVKNGRLLACCDCDIVAAFAAVPTSLKTERVRWHPDRFAVCKEEHKERFQQMASEVFKVVNRMYEDEVVRGE